MRKSIFALALGAVLALSLASAAFAQSKGSSTDMQVFYDCMTFTVNFTPVGLDASHKQVNAIYFFPDCMPSGMEGFIPVINAIQGTEKEPVPRNGFNPLWEKVKVTFTGGCPTSMPSSSSQMGLGLCTDNNLPSFPDDCGKTVMITVGSNTFTMTLNCTGQVFRCSVVGPGK